MGYLLDGRWSDDEHWPTDASGRFVRGAAQFRDVVGSDRFPAERGRYHLYLAHACPWCQRTAIARALTGLEDVVSVSFVHPVMLKGGWKFTEDYRDPLYGLSYAHELYTRADPSYAGRVTVPILWDKQRHTIVSNESADIVRMFDTAFGGDGGLYPEPLRAEIDAVNATVYDDVNNGVYRCGFARSQGAYEEAYASLWARLDELSLRLKDREYLVGDALTEADIRLYVTLARFDAVYYSHFKCNRNRICDDPALDRYLRSLYGIPAFRDTTLVHEIKAHYYGSHPALNPSGIVPVGPRLSFLGD